MYQALKNGNLIGKQEKLCERDKIGRHLVNKKQIEGETIMQSVQIDYAGKLDVASGNNREANGYKSFIHQNEAQIALTNQILSQPEGAFSGLLVIPTGGGKTFVAAEWLLKNWIDKNKKLLWIAHRHELLEQAFVTFRKNAYSNLLQHKKSLYYRIVSGQHDKSVHINQHDDILIASKDSLNQGIGYLIQNWIEANNLQELFLVIDEAHHATAKTYRKLINELKNRIRHLKILGLTATPFRTAEKEKGLLSKIFPNDIVYKSDLRTLISRGILSDPIFEEKATEWQAANVLTDEDFANIQKFDLPENIKVLLATQKERNNQIVDHYFADYNKDKKYGQLLVFALNIDHAIALSALFNDKGKPYGINADFIVSDIKDAVTKVSLSKENKEKIRKFRNKELQILINVNILSEGTDLPNTQTVFLTRPTISKILTTQMIGRGLRGAEAGGTEKAYIVTFIDNWQDKIAWVNPEKLFILDNVDFKDSNTETGKQLIRLVSIEKIAEFARIMDATVDTDKLEQLDFLDRIPVGVYAFSRLTADKEKNCEVLIYSHIQKQYADFINELSDIFERKKIDVENRENLHDIEILELRLYVKEKYFQNAQLQLGYRDEDITDILMYYFDNQQKPVFIPFEDRIKYNIDNIAHEIFQMDLGQKAKKQFVNELWESELVAWKSLFGYNKKYFLNEIDLSLRKIDHPDLFAITSKDEPVDVKEQRQFEDLSMSELYEKAPEYWRKLTDQVYKTYTNEDGLYFSAMSGYTSKSKMVFEIDHIIPFSKGGKTRLDNLQLLTWWENKQKRDKEETSERSQAETQNIPETVENKDTDNQQSNEFAALLEAAEQEHAWAQRNLGVMYYDGNGVPQDYTEAAKWYRKAAEQGLDDAQNYLGVLYENGEGVSKDTAKAAELYRKAAEQGHVHAQNNLALLYQAGEGVPQDYTEAAKWYRKAAEQGLDDAQNNLALLYQNGEGVPQDYTEAAKWYQKAAEQGNADAQNYLGILYDTGNGVQENPLKANELYRKAADQNHAWGQRNLGVMYYYGKKGIPINYEKAAYWYRKAAEQGLDDAQKSLAKMYAKGKGVRQDLIQAYVWFRLGCGDKYSKAFEEVKSKLTQTQLEQAEELVKQKAHLITTTPQMV